MEFDMYGFGEYMYERDHWIIFLAPNQSNLGTCVVALKRSERFLGGLKNEEWGELAIIVNELEKSTRRAFNATMFNWGVLLNTFYRENTPPPQLHWHFIPRYDHDVIVNGETFDDPFFGYMRPRPPKKVSRQTLDKIKSLILENIK